jgi:hypothetical protein
MFSSPRIDIVNMPGLVAYWRLNEASGTTALATVGPNGTYVNTPTLGATGLTSGDPKPAVSFDYASVEHVSIATGMPAGGTLGVSLAMLIKPSTYVTNDDHTLVNWGYQNDGTVGHAWWEFWEGGGGNLIYHYADGLKRAPEQDWYPVVGTRYHLVSVHDYRAETVTTYVDGALLGVIDVSANDAPLVIPANLPSYIGSYNGTLFNWTGVADEVALFNRPLTGAEAAQLARRARGF